MSALHELAGGREGILGCAGEGRLRPRLVAKDPAGNRTLEQIDDQATLATHDNMNRLTSQVPGGGLVFRGTVSEPIGYVPPAEYEETYHQQQSKPPAELALT